jgi:hypothetical protein
MKHIARADTTRVDYMVFLKRRAAGAAQLLPYRKDVARHFVRQSLYGPAESLAVRYAAIERLLTAEVFELNYSNLDEAIERLRKLVREGR